MEILKYVNDKSNYVKVRFRISCDIFNKIGANIVVPIISHVAGTKHIKKAGLPIFFNTLISKDNPDLVNIITKAICLK